MAYKPGEHKKKLTHHTALMRFRLGCLCGTLMCRPLHANRYIRKPRAERTCRVCNSSSVEDEKHALMECPAYEPLRRAVGFPEDMDMFEVLMTWDQVKLGGLLAQIQRARKELLHE